MATVGAEAPALPSWIEHATDGEPYEWAVSAWRRASSVPGAWFDAAKADGIVSRWPTIFRLTDDRFQGVPFLLLPWQAIVVRLLVGWKKPIEIIDPRTHQPITVHVRIFRRLDLWIPRKNGKSEFLASLAALFFVVERVALAQAFVFGRNEDQGFIPFNKLQAILAQADGLLEDARGNQRIVLNKKTIYVRETEALCQLLTGKPDGKHGRSPTVILGDEIHEWTTRELADTLRQGTGTRLQPIELYASTAGRKANRVGFEWYQESLGIMAGEIDDPTTLVVNFAIGDEGRLDRRGDMAPRQPEPRTDPDPRLLAGRVQEGQGTTSPRGPVSVLPPQPLGRSGRWMAAKVGMGRLRSRQSSLGHCLQPDARAQGLLRVRRVGGTRSHCPGLAVPAR